MMNAAVLIILGMVMAVAGSMLGGWWLLLCWPALSFGLVGAAYAGSWPGLFGKRPDGQLPLWRTVMLLPFLVLTHGLWHGKRLLSGGPAYQEVCPGLWLGRRLLSRELPPHIQTVIDVTCEFPEPGAIVRGTRYLCLPTLDAAAPGRDELLALLAKARDLPDVIYVHCAAGHGRSAMVVAALLLTRGLAADAKEALAIMRRARPGVRLTPAQYRLLESIVHSETT